MRILYMVGGFSSTDAIILNKCVQSGLETYLVYTRPEAADSKVLQEVNTFWIDLSRFHYLPKLFRWLIFGYEVISVARKIKPDVILCQGIQGHGLLSVLSGIRPIVLMPWGSDWAIVAHKNTTMRLLSRYVINHADLVQIDCEIGKNTILNLSGGKLQPDRIWVFPQGIELEIFKRNTKERQSLRTKLGWADKKILITTRQLKGIYGVDIFLKALSTIVRQDGDVRAVIVGGGPLEGELKILSASLGLGDFVRFTGRVNRDELATYLNAADIYVSTSFSDGTSLCLLEAMAAGLPAVVTDVPANFEWIIDGYNGCTAKRGCPEEVAQVLLKLLKDSETWKRFGHRSLRIAKERADWDKNFDKFLRMFDLLLQKQGKLSELGTLRQSEASQSDSASV
jgi:L-malate glycosyltransferase